MTIDYSSYKIFFILSYRNILYGDFVPPPSGARDTQFSKVEYRKIEEFFL